MGTKTTCDGTGVEIPDDTPTTGLFGHQYSDEARMYAEEYLENMSQLHTRYATNFQAELNELKALYREKLKELPDEP